MKLSNVRSINTGRVLSIAGRDWADFQKGKGKGLPKKEDGSSGEKSSEIDLAGYSKFCEFPEVDTPERLFDNIPFKMLPVIYIKSSKNNTLFNLTDHEGVSIYFRSCGVDGFKHSRKGSNIAAQVTAQSFGKLIIKRGYKICRVCINGMGAGRMSSFKGLQQAGITIVSITDSTPIHDYPKFRPPAARSV